MKYSGIYLIVALAFLGSSRLVYGQQTNTNLTAFAAMMTQLNSDIEAGKHTEADLAADIRQFDVVLAGVKGQPQEVSAYILLQKGILYAKVLNNPEKALAIFQEIQTNYPGTSIAPQLNDPIKILEGKAAIQKIWDSMPVGSILPDFNGTDLAGKPLSVAQFQGKVVLLDFWATWCPPCRRELPNVVAVYQKYHPQGFEIIGVTLDDDLAKVSSFIKDSQMPWPEHFEGKGWDNTLTAKYGVEAIPANILLDAHGRIIARNLMGDDLAQAVAQALVK